MDWEPPNLVFKTCFGASLGCNSGPHLGGLGIVDTEHGVVVKTPTDHVDEPIGSGHSENV